jgi:hypothetical protein
VPANFTKIAGPCDLCKRTLYDLAPSGPAHCPECDLALFIFWKPHEIDAEPAEYDKLLRQMPTLISMFPMGQREDRFCYRVRMREIFKMRHQLAIIPAVLKVPLNSEAASLIEAGMSITSVLARGVHHSRPAARPGGDRDALKVPGVKKRADVDQKPLRSTEAKKPPRKIKL